MCVYFQPPRQMYRKYNELIQRTKKKNENIHTCMQWTRMCVCIVLCMHIHKFIPSTVVLPLWNFSISDFSLRLPSFISVSICCHCSTLTSIFFGSPWKNTAKTTTKNNKLLLASQAMWMNMLCVWLWICETIFDFPFFYVKMYDWILHCESGCK